MSAARCLHRKTTDETQTFCLFSRQLLERDAWSPCETGYKRTFSTTGDRDDGALRPDAVPARGGALPHVGDRKWCVQSPARLGMQQSVQPGRPGLPAGSLMHPSWSADAKRCSLRADLQMQPRAVTRPRVPSVRCPRRCSGPTRRRSWPRSPSGRTRRCTPRCSPGRSSRGSCSS